MDLHQQLDELKRQMKDDFRFTRIALDDLGVRVSQVMREVSGRMEHQEHRFTNIIEIVQKELDSCRSHGTEIDDLKRRVQNLEDRESA